MTKPDKPENPSSRRLFGRRKGRPLRANKARLMQELLPNIRIDVLQNTKLDPRKLFPSPPNEIWLEIGFGGGEHLVAQAMQNPLVGFIGAEPFVNGVASLLTHIDKEKISNIRVFPDDARVLLDALPDASLDRCFVLFADPWPKARHAERRFIGPENLPRLSRVLKSGGELRLATDVKQLAEWMIAQLNPHRDFTSHIASSETPPSDWVATRYEQKGIRAGRKPAYFAYRRM